jgi:hypothetical protein
LLLRAAISLLSHIAFSPDAPAQGSALRTRWGHLCPQTPPTSVGLFEKSGQAGFFILPCALRLPEQRNQAHLHLLIPSFWRKYKTGSGA